MTEPLWQSAIAVLGIPVIIGCVVLIMVAFA